MRLRFAHCSSRRWLSIGLIALVALAPIACQSTGPDPTDPTRTTDSPDSVVSDPLPVDPRLTIGELDNGFRYVIQPHRRPPERVAMYLHIDSGALNETTSQNGLAHFLEHMAFNGSKNYPPGEILEEIERLGIIFGPHSNAHTGQFETVYKLFMPNTNEETLDTGFTMFADFAYGLSLLDSEIEKERPIIQNEKTSRDGVRYRTSSMFLDSVFGGTRFAEHDIIGTDEVIRTAPRREIKDYYDAWYQPQRMTLIVVGEVEPAKIERKVRRFFGPDVFQARVPARPDRTTGIKPVRDERAFVLSDPEQPRAEMQMIALLPGREPIRSESQYRHNEIENLGPWILSQRLTTLQESGDAAYDAAEASVQSVESDVLLPLAYASSSSEEWRASLEQVVHEVKRMVDHGAQPSELARAKEAMLAAAQRAVELESDLDAERVIDDLSARIGAEAPLISAAQHLAELEKLFDTVTVQDVNDVFRQNYGHGKFTYVVTLPERPDLTLPTSEQVLAIAREAWSEPTTPFDDSEAPDSILETLPAPGELAHRSHDDELDITTLEFANQAIVRHRAMDYQKELVLVRFTIPGGSIEETDETRGLSAVANLVNSTSRLSSTELRNFMVGKQVGVSAGFAQDAYHVVIQSSRADLETGLQVAFAYLTDGQIEEAQLRAWKDQLREEIATRDSQPSTQLERALHETLLGDDPRFRLLQASDLERLTADAAEAWLRRTVEQSPVEVAVVGDIALDAVLPLVSRYIGGLPAPSGDFDRLDPLRKIEREAGPYEVRREFSTLTPQAQAMIGYVGVNDDDVRDRRCLTLASFIITERMTRKIREELGLVYSIDCFNQPAQAIPDTGFFGVQVPTKPENIERLATAVTELMTDFAASGPSDAELQTTKRQILNLQKEAFEKPGFWVGQLSELTYRDRTLDQLKGIEEYYQQLESSDVRSAAERVIRPDRAIRLLAVPGATEAP